MRGLPARARLSVVVLLAGVIAACSGGQPIAPTGSPTSQSTPTAPPNATYRVTFDSTWSAATHPQDIPPDPHFSGLIGGTHNSSVRFWQEGTPASDGIRNMAELGRKTPLDAEIMAAISGRTAEHLLSGGGIALSPGSVSLEFPISRDYSLVTLVSMVAPSPDWFVGVSSLSLFENGQWVDERTISLRPYDAGTDSGTTYNSPDQATSPRQSVSLIQGPPFSSGGQVNPLGTFTFRRLQ